MKTLQHSVQTQEIDWTPELQEQFVAAIEADYKEPFFARIKNKFNKTKNRFVKWFKVLPTWKKVVLILAALAALGLLTWFIVSTLTPATASGIYGAGSLYAITDGTATKIGLTGRDVAQRAGEISRYAPGSFVYGSIPVPNMLKFERLAHNHFRPFKYDDYLGSREWFDIEPRKAMNYLNKMVA